MTVGKTTMKTYKAEITIPTEAFGNIKPTVEGTPQAIVEAYKEFAKEWKGGEGLTEAEMDSFIEKQLLGESNDINQYERATPNQKTEIQRIKRALKRIKARQK